MTSIPDLTSRIKGDVITPDHPEYGKSLQRWAVNAERNAAVVVFVKNESDVSTAISYARTNNLPVAIRGGGHNATGASSTEGGLVIDLSRHLNLVRIDPEKRLAYVGGGALWEAVDKAAIEHGLATPGGTVNHTGVGGLILGGGFGWLSGEHGLTIDNLVQVTLVSADGSVHKANDTENPDLFFGVRGGGCNFGVVTEFVLALHPQRRTVFSGPIIFPGTHLEKIVDAAKDWYANTSPKEAMIMMTTCEPDGTPVVPCYIFYNGSEEEGRAKFKRFYDIGPVADMTKEVPYEVLNSLQNPMVNHGNGVYWKGVAHEGPSYKPIAMGHEKIVEIVKAGKFHANAIYEWIPLQKINSVPGNRTAYRRIPNPNCLIVVGWPGKTHSGEKVAEARPLAYEIAACLAGGLAALKDVKSQGYSNYDPDPEGIVGEKGGVKDKALLAFGANYPTLQRIKKKYDPENIFNKWFAITPA
ncbi:FAD-binding domain-containing protein [Macrolepiota fuliginosa MF-IS2]|uniref:FAD-binding domain-containing protein n=1 Tax=Macrolepiota fuliginosa MF-IS2 TaxID=1400762 RepID=A0A9P5XIP6_9AGAR|nr:FAD-binding domain-containing protein [Macrolepiota fuliginosa MF-IS2]